MTASSETQGSDHVSTESRGKEPFRGTVSHLLLDIEGTTCPVDFVAGTLFPYATRRLESYLSEQREEMEVSRLIRELEAAWRNDDSPRAVQLRLEREEKGPISEQDTNALVPYLQHLIESDRKLTPLKQLQGMIWEQGYARGELLAPLFPDVAAALQRWQQQGRVLAVYSSGSVQAQRLLYRHTTSGNLEDCFQHWFDTRTGAKQDPQSYEAIARAMGCPCQSILFISDMPAELEAASRCGMQTLFSDREGNPIRDAAGFPSVQSFDNPTLAEVL